MRIASASFEKSRPNGARTLLLTCTIIENLSRTAPEHCESHLRTLKKLARTPPEHLGSHLRTSKNLAPTVPERRANVANRICEHGKTSPERRPKVARRTARDRTLERSGKSKICGLEFQSVFRTVKLADELSYVRLRLLGIPRNSKITYAWRCVSILYSATSISQSARVDELSAYTLRKSMPWARLRHECTLIA